MTDLTHNPDHYPHNGGNADTDLLCRACEMGVPVKRAMPGPPECECREVPEHLWTTYGGYVDPVTQIEYNPECPERGEVSSPKRLADAEAAAEYWRAEAEEADARGRSWFYEDPATVNAERLKASLAADRARAWHRFAHTSHALEVGA